MLEPMIEIGTGFKLPESIDLSTLNKLPIQVHKYGDPQPSKDTFRWMSYQNEGNISGSIDFARDCGKFFPEVANYTVEYLSNLLDMHLSPNFVNFMKTNGNITPHTDEVRKSCINIGIENTESAITRFYINDTHKDYCVKPGSVYLVDVSKTHAVHSTNNITRLLITYGFVQTFDQIYNKLKHGIHKK